MNGESNELINGIIEQPNQSNDASIFDIKNFTNFMLNSHSAFVYSALAGMALFYGMEYLREKKEKSYVKALIYGAFSGLSLVALFRLAKNFNDYISKTRNKTEQNTPTEQ